MNDSVAFRFGAFEFKGRKLVGFRFGGLSRMNGELKFPRPGLL